MVLGVGGVPRPFRHAGDNVAFGVLDGTVAALTFTLAKGAEQRLARGAHLARRLRRLRDGRRASEQISARGDVDGRRGGHRPPDGDQGRSFRGGGAAMSALQVGEGAPVPFSSTPRGRLRAEAASTVSIRRRSPTSASRSPSARARRQGARHGRGAQSPCGDRDAGPTKAEDRLPLETASAGSGATAGRTTCGAASLAALDSRQGSGNASPAPAGCRRSASSATTAPAARRRRRPPSPRSARRASTISSPSCAASHRRPRVRRQV